LDDRIVMKYATRIRDAQLRVISDAFGPAPVMKIYASDEPPDCDSSTPVGELAMLELPRRPFKNPVGGRLEIAESWLGEAHTDGVAKCFRIETYLGEVVLQGSVSAPDGDGDLKLDPPKMENGQRISVAGFTLDMSDARYRRKREKAA
jgi:hypothetical protein